MSEEAVVVKVAVWALPEMAALESVRRFELIREVRAELKRA